MLSFLIFKHLSCQLFWTVPSDTRCIDVAIRCGESINHMGVSADAHATIYCHVLDLDLTNLQHMGAVSLNLYS